MKQRESPLRFEVHATGNTIAKFGYITPGSGAMVMKYVLNPLL